MQYEAKTNSVFEELRASILTGELAPDTPLRISALSKRYIISATPVREALSRLEEKRLVVASPNCGWRVSPVSYAELEDLEEARLTIESRLLIDAIAFGGVEWEANIVSAHYKLSKTPKPIGTQDIDTRQNWMDAHDLFHNALLAAAKTTWLKRFYNETTEQLQRHHQALLFHPLAINPEGLSQHSPETIELLEYALSIPQHTKLMDQVLDRDAPGSIKILKSHVEITLTVYKSMATRLEMAQTG